MRYIISVIILIMVYGCISLPSLPIDHSKDQFNNQVETMLNYAIPDCENNSKLYGVSNVQCEGYIRNMVWETINQYQ